ncbi:MAG TPA: ATP-binding protein [Bacteroidetes bacterium]|nr:ATP-binding protein [Bacteroidota bacterium]
MVMKVEIGSKVENLRIIEGKVDELILKMGINKDEYGRIMVATMEAVNNAIVHGNQHDDRKNVSVSFECNRNDFVVKVRDEGIGFNPDCIPDPTSPENIENIRGRGVFLMKNLADDIGFNESGNEVIMKFNIETVATKNIL